MAYSDEVYTADDRPCVNCGAAADAPCAIDCDGRVFLASYKWNNGLAGPKVVYTVPPALPTDSQARKDTPIYSGVLRYFPRALAYIAKVSKAGNDKHNPGQPLHWSKGKSNDHADCLARHLIEAGTIDPDDNLRHSGKAAWRAMALLETELEDAEKSA